MTARTLSEEEAQPASRPDLLLLVQPDPLGDRDVDLAVIWERLEAYCTRRWPAREVVYVAEGAGWWRARLHPFTVETCQVWTGATWEACVLDPTPLDGLELPGLGPYRITGTAGDDTHPPMAFVEAFQRLYDVARGIAQEKFGGMVNASEDTPIGWAAKAMQLSGAADLLRPYRRLG